MESFANVIDRLDVALDILVNHRVFSKADALGCQVSEPNELHFCRERWT